MAASALPASAMQASKAALSSVLADNKILKELEGSKNEASNGENLEDGEIQEVDMESQAEGIRTVFSDPTNFNVKVSSMPAFVLRRHYKHL